jgi:hypothetical protein
MLEALRMAESALSTHRVLQRPPPFLREGGVALPAAAHTKCELQPIQRAFYDRRAGKTEVPSMKTGIKFHRPMFNNLVVLNENYLVLLYLYQLCRYSYSMKDVKAAKQSYHIALRHFLRWRSVLSGKVTKSFWRVISITLRLSESSAKQKGRPLCGTQPRLDNLLSARPIPLGVLD